MISPVSSSTPPQLVSQAQPPVAKPAATTPQDSVSLSPQALKAAGGDADHDGDSH
jgi:microcystin-dependent protein